MRWSLAVAVLVLFHVAAAPRAALAGTTSAVTTAGVTPAAFVPDWDGHTDSTVVQYYLAGRSSVQVRVLDARGRFVATVDAGIRSAGMQLVAWDGRSSAGRVLPPGMYRVRVDARPAPLRPATATPATAELGGAVTVAGARAATVTIQSPPVAVRGVRLGRAALGRSRRSASTAVHFDLSTAASISAAIVDSRGRGVRTLAARRMPAGANRLGWNGRTARGATLPDGDYSLVVAASGRGRPTATTRVPLRVDRTLPTMRAPVRVRARAAAEGLSIPLVVTVGEDSTLVVRAGRRAVRRTLPKGTHRLALPATELGIAGTRRSRTVALRLLLRDAAGNAVRRRLSVQVPPVTRRAARPRVPAPAPPATSGRLPWPVDGIVTSEFGMRSGRPHTGIDIAAPTGTPLHPVAPGRVSYMGVLGGYGNLVILEHSDGLRTYYAHLSRFGGFGVGDAVGPLDTIGFVGCTGSCTGPHVHFETRIEDVPQDPRSYLAPR